MKRLLALAVVASFSIACPGPVTSSGDAGETDAGGTGPGADAGSKDAGVADGGSTDGGAASDAGAVPGAPGTPSAVAGDQQATVSWTAPASTGDSAIVNYVVVADDGSSQQSWSVPGGETAYTATGLVNGTTYTFTVAAVNATGSGPASGPSNAVTPGTVADAPGTPVATAGSAQASLSWTAPQNNGGAPVTSYTVTPSIGGVAQASIATGSSGTSYTVTGLTDGTAYTFTVAATNAWGTGAASAASNAVTPADVPSAPGIPSATAGDAQVSLSWAAPSSTGGAALSSYTVTPYVNGVPQSPVPTGNTNTSYTLTGLTNGTTYRFTVAATNAIGTGPKSGLSTPATPFSVYPNPPTQVSGQPGLKSVSVSWTPPSYTGTSALTGFVVTTYLSGVAQTPTTVVSGGSVKTATVSGLADGTTYTFTVAATNSSGTGAESSPSAPVTTDGVPTPPQNAAASIRDQSAQVSWSPPASNGGTAVTGYVITPYDGTTALASSTAIASATTLLVGGLTNGKTYTFQIVAQNAVGNSPPATTSGIVPAFAVESYWPMATDHLVTPEVHPSVVFNGPVNWNTVTASSFTVTQGASPVAGTLSIIGNGSVFTPSAPLTPNAPYTVTLTSAIQDSGGNALAPFSFTFTPRNGSKAVSGATQASPTSVQLVYNSAGNALAAAVMNGGLTQQIVVSEKTTSWSAPLLVTQATNVTVVAGPNDAWGLLTQTLGQVGANAWIYHAGTLSGPIASNASSPTLAANDQGFLLVTNDFTSLTVRRANGATWESADITVPGSPTRVTVVGGTGEFLLAWTEGGNPQPAKAAFLPTGGAPSTATTLAWTQNLSNTTEFDAIAATRGPSGYAVALEEGDSYQGPYNTWVSIGSSAGWPAAPTTVQTIPTSSTGAWGFYELAIGSDGTGYQLATNSYAGINATSGQLSGSPATWNWGATQPLGSGFSLTPSGLRVTANAAGGYAVSWLSDTTGYLTQLPASSPSAQQVAAPFDVAAVTGVSGASGGFLAVSTGSTGLQSMRSAAAGGWTSPASVPGTSGGTAPSLSPTPSGAGLAFIQGAQVEATSFTPGTGTFGTAQQVPVAAPGDARSPTLGLLSNGEVVAVWEQFDLGQWNTYGSLFDGTAWSAPLLIDTGTSGVALAEQGTTALVADRVGTTLYARTWSGGSLGARSVVSTSAGTAGDLAAAASATQWFVGCDNGSVLSGSVATDPTQWPGSPTSLDVTGTAGSLRAASDGSTFGVAHLVSTSAMVTLYSGGAWSPVTGYSNNGYQSAYDFQGGPGGYAVATGLSGGFGGAQVSVWSSGNWSQYHSLGYTDGIYTVKWVALASNGNDFSALFDSTVTVEDVWTPISGGTLTPNQMGYELPVSAYAVSTAGNAAVGWSGSQLVGTYWGSSLPTQPTTALSSMTGKTSMDPIRVLASGAAFDILWGQADATGAGNYRIFALTGL